MNNKEMKQEVTDGSVAIQAAGDVVYQGLSYDEVRQVTLDVLKLHFSEFTGVALKTFQERGEKITDDFLNRLKNENPEGFDKASDPAFQFRLSTVQKEYGKTGDDELGSLLVDLLIDSTKEEERSLMQLVLNESLLTAPKLSENHLAALSLAFIFTRTQNFGVVSHETLGAYFDSHVEHFGKLLPISQASFQYLEFCGCGSINYIGSAGLASMLGRAYRGLFVKGFDKEKVDSLGLTPELTSEFIIQCLNAPEKLQINARNEDDLSDKIQVFNVDDELAGKLKGLLNSNAMNDVEVRETCVKIRPYMETVFTSWSESLFQNFNLTSVGLAIAHANLKRCTNFSGDLSIWIT